MLGVLRGVVGQRSNPLWNFHLAVFSQQNFPNARKHCALRSRFSLEKGGYVFGSGLGAMLCKRGYREEPIVCLGDYSTMPTAVGACIGNIYLASVLFFVIF